MQNLRKLGERLPGGERLYSFLAIGAVIIVSLGYLAFILFSIVPQVQARQELLGQLSAAEQALLTAQGSQDGGSQALQTQVAAAQATLDAASGAFLSESEAAGVLNSLYGYARESAVEIVDLQAQPGSSEGEKSIYDAKTFRLSVQGTTAHLIDFVARIREASIKTLVINNVTIAEGEAGSSLTFDITLHTSPYASSASGSMTPVATPQSLAGLESELNLAWAARDWQRAVELLVSILAIVPGDATMTDKLYSARVNYGYQLLEEGKTGEATVQFNLALEIRSDGPEALAGLKQTAVTPSPARTAADALADQLHAPWAAENWPEVIDLIQRILAIDPNYAGMRDKLYAAHVNYGYRLKAEGRLEEARAEFIRALDLRPDGAEALAGLRELAGETPLPSEPSPVPVTPTPLPDYIIYVVQQGDTLYSIARRYNTSVQAIQVANGLPDTNIHVGQQLRVPTGSSSAPDGSYQIHVVQSGETLYAIARRYGTTVQTIMTLNGLTSTDIRVGQQLRVPAP
ncbi:MAG: LysM peptidoglycan-binding domain-containing protein [Chloroflexota bacterium]